MFWGGVLGFVGFVFFLTVLGFLSDSPAVKFVKTIFYLRSTAVSLGA